ncbi:MAG: hypothetical protein K8T89_01905 [Planctomycetes bacterium]|nr:hypothetical protein [Planctomycetota bacterium]
MNSKSRLFTALCLLTVFDATSTRAQSPDEFKLKRQEIFEFTQKPQVTRTGDKVDISFTVKAYCDVTIVIEDPQGKIVRHLISGVLGDKAPLPLQKNSLVQKITWDGKNDQGNYIDDKDKMRVRVSLGLKANYESDLYSEPKKRTQSEACLMAAAPEGVYVYDGRVLDHLRLFDHDGNYLRTIYPFPANQVRNVKGLHWFKMPQDGLELPMREGFHQGTLLSSGTNAGFDPKLNIGIDVHNNYHGSVWGNAVSTLAVRDSRIALAQLCLNRLATNGSSGGLEITGPATSFPLPLNKRGDIAQVHPRSSAFSPDGKTLYLTGYVYAHGQQATRDIVLIAGYSWLPVVAKIDFAEGKQLEIFAGSTKPEATGTGAKEFKIPSSVAVDGAGRVYVSDYANDRVQVFSPAGELLKSIAATKPAQVAIHSKTGEIYVFSWVMPTNTIPKREDTDRVGSLTILKSFADPRPVQTLPLPLGPTFIRSNGFAFRAELDAHAEPPTIWFCKEWGRQDILTKESIKHTNVSLYTLANGKLTKKRDFNEDAVKSVVRTEAAEYARQRLNVDPATGMLYLNEGQAAAGKSFKDVVRVDPETKKVEIVNLPFDAEDMCFDADGLAYLRTFYQVARFNPRNWSEVPWDYGEEVNGLRTSSSGDGRVAKVTSALRLPVKNAGLHHHGGMTVSLRGHLVVAVNNTVEIVTRKDIYDTPKQNLGQPYTPPAFPGRTPWGEVHVWDKHGKMLYDDAVPGINRLDGLGMDRDNNLYVMSNLTRMFNGERYFNDMTGSLLKVQAKKNKVIGTAETALVPLADAVKPKRPPDVSNPHTGATWVEGAEWFYGGVGFAGKNASRSGGGCDCYNARFALDYLGRSFAPEIDHCSVAVVDSNGNLILRIGQYGNLDSAGPKSLVPLSGDGVGLFYAPYVATHTDKRLFIADPGNGRVVSVKLGYHATETVMVK